MSLEVMVHVMKHSPARLGDRLVLLALAEHAHDDGGNACPSVETIATRANLSPRQTQRCLRSLLDAGLIVAEGTHPRYRSTIYRLILDAPEPPVAPSAEPSDAEELPQMGDDRLTPSEGDILTSGGDIYDTQMDKMSPNPSRTPYGGSTRERESAPAPERAICEGVASHVLELDPNAQVDVDDPGWASAARGILADGRPAADVLTAIRDLDDFWAPKVLSPVDLRRHLPRIVAAQAASRRGPGRSSPGPHRGARNVPDRGPAPGSCVHADDDGVHPVDGEWRAILAALRRELPASEFDIWIAPCHPHYGPDDELLIAAPAKARTLTAQRFGRLVNALVGRPVAWVACQHEHL